MQQAERAPTFDDTPRVTQRGGCGALWHALLNPNARARSNRSEHIHHHHQSTTTPHTHRDPNSSCVSSAKLGVALYRCWHHASERLDAELQLMGPICWRNHRGTNVGRYPNKLGARCEAQKVSMRSSRWACVCLYLKQLKRLLCVERDERELFRKGLGVESGHNRPRLHRLHDGVVCNGELEFLNFTLRTHPAKRTQHCAVAFCAHGLELFETA
jgi:hypothetical protein